MDQAYPFLSMCGFIIVILTDVHSESPEQLIYEV